MKLPRRLLCVSLFMSFFHVPLLFADGPDTPSTDMDLENLSHDPLKRLQDEMDHSDLDEKIDWSKPLEVLRGVTEVDDPTIQRLMKDPNYFRELLRQRNEIIQDGEPGPHD